MKKKLLTTTCAALMSLSLCIPTFAGQWKSDANGWWWQNDNGSWPANTWQWIDGNNDGTAECYYFNGNGYMLESTTTPDGYTVGADGAWVENGVVQTQVVKKTETQPVATSSAKYNDDYSGVYTVPFYEMDNTVSSQTVTIAYNNSANAITATFSRLGYTETYTYAGTDFRGFTFFELESEYEKDAIFFSAPGVIEWPSADGTQSVSRN